MKQRHYPSIQEEEFLKLGYNRFLDLFEVMTDKSFWLEPKEHRLLLIKELFSVYVELIKYKPLKSVLSNSARPHTTLVGKDLVAFLRNLLLHFPFFASWEEVVFNQNLIRSIEDSGSTDRFLLKEHPGDIKYRMWDAKEKTMTYVVVNLHTKYKEGKDVFLSQILPEKEGVIFLCSYMNSVLMSQVEEIK